MEIAGVARYFFVMTEKRNQNATIETPVGKLSISSTGGHVTGIGFVHSNHRLRGPSGIFLKQVASRIRRYMRKPESLADVPVKITGTSFQLAVWDALRKIPPGEVMTYGDLADKLGSGARAVGNACRENPVPILIPCHRVVAANGLGGFAGQRHGKAIDRKHWLLVHEGALEG